MLLQAYLHAFRITDCLISVLSLEDHNKTVLDFVCASQLGLLELGLPPDTGQSFSKKMLKALYM